MLRIFLGIFFSFPQNYQEPLQSRPLEKPETTTKNFVGGPTHVFTVRSIENKNSPRPQNKLCPNFFALVFFLFRNIARSTSIAGTPKSLKPPPKISLKDPPRIYRAVHRKQEYFPPAYTKWCSDFFFVHRLFSAGFFFSGRRGSRTRKSKTPGVAGRRRLRLAGSFL